MESTLREDQAADKRSDVFTNSSSSSSSIKRICPKPELTGFLCDSHWIYTYKMGENSFPSEFAVSIAKMNRVNFSSLIFRHDELSQRKTELMETGFSCFMGNLQVWCFDVHPSQFSAIRDSLSHLEMVELGVILHSPAPAISV